MTPTTERVDVVDGVSVAVELQQAIRDSVLPGTEIGETHFWSFVRDAVREFRTRNRRLLDRRDTLQEAIDAWMRDRSGQQIVPAELATQHRDIGYLVDDPGDVQVTTEVDDEIGQLAAPQLVTPAGKASFLLKAANCRIGGVSSDDVTLYDALYMAKDVIPEDDGCEITPGTYNPKRGAKVVAYVEEQVLDAHFPLSGGAKWSGVTAIRVDRHGRSGSLSFEVSGGREIVLNNPKMFVGYNLAGSTPSEVLLRHPHGLHLQIKIDRKHPVGNLHPAGICDIVLEAAATTIVDFEDAEARVLPEDFVLSYTNWAGLMRGDLEAEVARGDRSFTRRLNGDQTFTAPNGDDYVLRGRGLLLVRNAGIHLETDVVKVDGKNAPEGILDAYISGVCVIHDRNRPEAARNSRLGKAYIVKPKLHGPEEVQFGIDVLARAEADLSLPGSTLLIGIMDEERRTTVNLRACIAAAKDRLFFINTGFLDRTGDEMHTGMEAGPMLPVAEMKSAAWMIAYERWNVQTGLECGLRGHAQIGKGMWPKPAEMAEMMPNKVGQLEDGASTFWVPSPTAAVFGALAFLNVNVRAVQEDLAGQELATLDQLLTVPVLEPGRELDADTIRDAVNNATQAIAGYVSRWVMLGVGCSSIPNIAGVDLMEDCATCRINFQLLVSWQLHDVVTADQVMESLGRQAELVDKQAAEKGLNEQGYKPMAEDPDNPGFLASSALASLAKRGLPNGYVEPILYVYRRRAHELGFARAA